MIHKTPKTHTHKKEAQKSFRTTTSIRAGMKIPIPRMAAEEPEERMKLPIPQPTMKLPTQTQPV